MYVGMYVYIHLYECICMTPVQKSFVGISVKYDNYKSLQGVVCLSSHVLIHTNAVHT